MIDLFLVLQVAIWIAATVAIFVRGKASIFHPACIYLVFHLIVFVVRPIEVHYLNFDLIWTYMKFEPSEEQFVLTLLASSLGLVIFVGACLFAARGAQSVTEPFYLDISRNQIVAFGIVSAVLFPVAIYSIIEVGGAVKGERVGGTYVMTEGNGYINDAQNVLTTLLVVFIYVCRFRLFSMIPLLGYFSYRAIMGRNRWTIVLTFFLLVLVYCWDRRIRMIPRRALIFVPVIFVLFATLGSNREFFKNILLGRPQDNHAWTAGDRDFKQRFDTMDFANFDYLAYIISTVPDLTGTYTYGTQYLQLFTEPIPRELWKNKPIGAPIQFFDLNDYGNFIGLTPSMVGDGWMSGGWTGLILTAALSGYLLGRLFLWFSFNQADVYKAMTYLVTVTFTIQYYRDGAISIFHFLMFTLPPIYFWKWITSALSHSSSFARFEGGFTRALEGKVIER